jgi:hypothetical protein
MIKIEMIIDRFTIDYNEWVYELNKFVKFNL